MTTSSDESDNGEPVRKYQQANSDPKQPGTR